MDKSSAEKLVKVHPDLSKRVAAVIAQLALNGMDVRVVQGLRTYAEQDALYAQGRTKPGEKVTNARGGFSNHNFGLAVDLCPFVGDNPDWKDTSAFHAIGLAGKTHGLLWGGDWKKFKDLPHLELHGPDLAECRILFAQGGLAAVWAKVNAGVNTIAAPRVLKLGDSGDDVKAVQKALGITADGIFGKATEAEIKKFQAAHNLIEDGQAGPNTKKALGL